MRTKKKKAKGAISVAAITIPSYNSAQCSVRMKRLGPEYKLSAFLFLPCRTLRFSPFTIIMLFLQVLDDPAEDNLHMGMRNIFSFKNFTFSLSLPHPVSAFGARHICHRHCSYNIHNSSLPSTPP